MPEKVHGKVHSHDAEKQAGQESVFHEDCVNTGQDKEFERFEPGPKREEARCDCSSLAQAVFVAC